MIFNLLRNLLLSLPVLLSAAACHAQETIAIEFTQKDCHYCEVLERSLKPLVAEGFAIRQVDVHAPAGSIKGTTKSGLELAASYGVKTTPALFVQSFGADGKAKSLKRIDHMDTVSLRSRLLAAGVHYLPPAPQSTD